MTPIREFLSRLERVREHRNGWSARCPAHDDSDPSLSVKQGNTHPIVVHCFAGCSMEEIAMEVGMSPADFFEDSEISDKVRRREKAAPRPSVEHSDEEWERRHRLWQQMTEGELLTLQHHRKYKWKAKENRDSEAFYNWVDLIESLYGMVEKRLNKKPNTQ